jgi:hypothetical protein
MLNRFISTFNAKLIPDLYTYDFIFYKQKQ